MDGMMSDPEYKLYFYLVNDVTWWAVLHIIRHDDGTTGLEVQAAHLTEEEAKRLLLDCVILSEM
jgi:hypothetical protein